MRRTGSLVAVWVYEQTHLIPCGAHNPAEFIVNETSVG